jgi:regulator of nonsense transcripts 2
LPLLATFLKSYSYPYLGLLPPASSKLTSEPESAGDNGEFPELVQAQDELVELDIRERFRKMCIGYYENVSKKLVIEHTVSRFPLFMHTIF